MQPLTKNAIGENAEMKIEQTAGNIIRTEMIRCGYTLDSLSMKTDISSAVLRGILTGRSKTISTRSICSLARTFGYSAAEFMDLLAGNSIQSN